MAEKLCQLKKKGGGSVELLEPNISEVLTFQTNLYIHNADETTTPTTASSPTTNFIYTYGNTTWTVKARTAGKYRVIGMQKNKGMCTELVTANENDVIAQIRYMGSAPLDNVYQGGIVYKVSN